MIFLITIKLGEPEKGVKYFFKHSKERDKEITLYCALDLADWMEVYKYGLSKGIRPRDSLRENMKNGRVNEVKKMLQESNRIELNLSMFEIFSIEAAARIFRTAASWLRAYYYKLFFNPHYQNMISDNDKKIIIDSGF